MINHDAGVYIVTGGTGSGKTAFALAAIVDLYKRTAPVRAREGRPNFRFITNVAIKPNVLLGIHDVPVERFANPWPCPKRRPIFRPGEAEDVKFPLVWDRSTLPLDCQEEIRDAIVLVDECHKFFDGTRPPEDFLNLLYEKRKRDLTIVLLTPPVEEVPAAIRRLADQWVEMWDSTKNPTFIMGIIPTPAIRMARRHPGYTKHIEEQQIWNKLPSDILECYDTQGGSFGYLPEDIPTTDIQRSKSRWARHNAVFIVGNCVIGVIAAAALLWARSTLWAKPQRESYRPTTSALPSSIQSALDVPSLPRWTIDTGEVAAVGEDSEGRPIWRHVNTPGRWFRYVGNGQFEEVFP